MNKQIKAIVASKQVERKRLAGLSFSEKTAMLEKLRDRHQTIVKTSLSRKNNPPRRKFSIDT